MTTPNTQIAVPANSDNRLLAPRVDSGASDGKARLAYVGFRGAKSRKRVEELDAAGVEESQFYLMDGEIIALDPCDLHILDAYKFWSKVDDEGEAVDVLLEDGGDEAFQEGYRQHVIAAVAIVLGEGTYVPASLVLRSAQTRALDTALAFLDPAKGGAALDAKKFAARSAKHKEAAKVVFPGGRFRTRIRSKIEPTESGREMNKGYGTVFPTPAEEVNALNAWIAEDRVRIDAILAQHDTRVAAIKALAAGEKQ